MALPIAAIANGVKTAIDLAKTDNSTGSETKFADVKPYEVESTDIKRTEGDLGYDTPEVEEEPSVEPSAEQPNEIPEIADVANVDRPENETTTQDVQPLTKGSLDNIFNLADGIASQSEETVNESAPVDNSIRNTYTEAPQSSDVGFTATTLGNAVETAPAIAQSAPLPELNIPAEAEQTAEQPSLLEQAEKAYPSN